MTTRISSKGQVVLPVPIRRKLGLRPGDSLVAAVEGDRIILSRVKARPPEARIGIDAVTGLPVLKVTAKAQKLTSQQVAEMLTEFPSSTFWT
jgi:AbrB family looped-hinge helix DNA binding protein